MIHRKKLDIKIFAFAILVGLSIASFSYLQSLEATDLTPQEEIFVEDVEDDKELLPDVQIIRKLMHKTLDFVIQAPPMLR